MTPSPLYSKLFSLCEAHCNPPELDTILSIRSTDARHGWGHNRLVSLNPSLQGLMDNEGFKAHLLTTGPYLTATAKVHDIVVDEHQRKASARMSYFLKPTGSDEVVENDLIWTFKFTDDEDIDKVLIRESIEFVDASANFRVGRVAKQIHGELNKDVRGGIAITVIET
ncbi:hypothetical protein GYMLUDRAFT_59533 [Collybiopsis luxurians FD-317 M1]|uniref:Uncharacterized protein n=1 Tax=Collybiopsis luxurians FD-317 M1 TaxID=944289 RepID=A0A0D0BXJ4_9AGAR|nr:hypothetical protein GYMLUDRAFT_59533 [Collybiopsis luxurians FD-317 M1]